MRFFSLATGMTAALLILAAAPATAEVFRCKMQDGRMAYQDVACPETGEQKVVAPSRIAPPPPRRMTQQDYYEQQQLNQAEQARYRQQMLAAQLSRRHKNDKPYVAGIGEATNSKGCPSDVERRRAAVKSGAYHRTGVESQGQIEARRAELERCGE